MGQTPDGGGGTSQKTQTLTVTWKIQKPNGSEDQCSTTYSKVKVVASAFGNPDERQRNGADRTALFDCSAKTGTMKLQVSGDEPDGKTADGFDVYGGRAVTGKFAITVVLTDSTGELEHQAMLSQDVDLSKGDKALEFIVTPSAAPLGIAWGFRSAMTQESLPSCGAAGVAQVRVKSRRLLLPDLTADPAPVENVETFPCGFEYVAGRANVDCMGCQGAALTKPVLFGSYAISIEALDAANVVVGTVAYGVDANLRVDHESLVFSRTAGAAVSRSDIGISSRTWLKVNVNR